MILRSIRLAILWLQAYLVSGQNWPGLSKYTIKDKDSTSTQMCGSNPTLGSRITPDLQGEEYYCNGNLKASGSLRKTGTYELRLKNENNRKQHLQFFEREGIWTVFYDSTVRIIKSEGLFIDGAKAGKWRDYYPNQKIKQEVEYHKDQIKQKVVYDEQGNRHVEINRSTQTIFLLNHHEASIFMVVYGEK